MDCESCSERLPDFLLDELPESEAVMVQEHLNLCAACMRTYKDLKGTGKALEAVPSLRAVQGTPEFERAVRAQAVVELANIVAKLPPDKRLKLEARRAARMSRVIERPPPPVRRAFSVSLMLLVLAGVAALIVILLYPQKNPAGEKPPAGVLKMTSGKVEQFYQRSGEPHSAVQEGKNIFPGDSYLTPDSGRARFDLSDGSSLFLGPTSQVTFRVQSPGTENFVIVLEKGELGVQRPHNVIDHSDGQQAPQEWEIRAETGSVLVDPGAHVHISVRKNGKELKETVTAYSESVKVFNHSMQSMGTLYYGHAAEFTADEKELKSEALTKARVPAWRLDLVTEEDLSELLSARVKIVGRHDGTLRAELLYTAQNPKQAMQDWVCEPASSASEKPASGLLLPASARLAHIVPFSAPLSIELGLSRDNSGDGAFAFGALETANNGVSVDVAREARLQVRENGRTVRSGVAPARAASGKVEKLQLDINKEGGGFGAQLSTSAEKTNVLPLPKEIHTGKLWLQGLNDNVSFDEVKISGVIPAEWLKEKLSK